MNRLLSLLLLCVSCAGNVGPLLPLDALEEANTLDASRFVKVSNSGKALPSSATTIGSGPDDWACTFDTTTKLMWEVKSTDSGLHDRRWTYSWYEPQTTSPVKGWSSSGTCGLPKCDTQHLREATNAGALCGFTGWRMPSRQELGTLVYCAAGPYTQYDAWVRGYPCADYLTNFQPKTYTQFFPDIDTTVRNGAFFFWTSDSYDVIPEYVFYVNFRSGGQDRVYKSDTRGVRLVTSAPSFQPTPNPPTQNPPTQNPPIQNPPTQNPPTPPGAFGVVFSGQPSTVTRVQFSLSGPLRMSLDAVNVPADSTQVKWIFETTNLLPIVNLEQRTSHDLLCDSGTAVTRCSFPVSPNIPTGRYYLTAKSTRAGGQVVSANELAVDVVP